MGCATGTEEQGITYSIPLFDMNTTAQVPASVDAYYSRRLLLRVMAANLHGMFAMQKEIPANSGTKTIRFRRYTPLSPATTPLVQGQNPAGDTLANTDITGEVQTYGNYVPLAAEVMWMTVNTELTEISDLLVDNAEESLDIITREVLNSGTVDYYGGNATDRGSIDSNDKVSETLLKEIALDMKNAKAKKLKRFASTNSDVDTQNMRETYVGITSPEVVEDLRGLTGWIDREKYPHTSSLDLMPEEVGKFGDFRFVETVNAKKWPGAGSGGTNVYSIVFLGQEAYGQVKITGQSLRSHIKPVGSAGAGDPLDRFGTMGWSSTFLAMRLNENFMARAEVATTLG